VAFKTTFEVFTIEVVQPTRRQPLLRSKLKGQTDDGDLQRRVGVVCFSRYPLAMEEIIGSTLK